MERIEAYKGLEHARRMVMLVRGGAPASFAGGFQRGKQVHLIPLGSTLLVECALHLQENIIKVKAGPQPNNIQLHSLNGNTLTSAAELAHRLYALLLAPICTTVVLAEGEFEAGELDGIEAIVQLLVSWTRMILAYGGRLRYRPQVVIFRKRPACLPGDLESRMTGKILATCNFTRELTSKVAEGMWRQCFSGIVAIPMGIEDELGVCEEAIAALSGDQACPALPAHRLPLLLYSACAKFSFNYFRPVNVLQASRLFTIPEDLPRQLALLFRHARSTPAQVALASRVTASVLVKDMYHANLLAFRSDHVFEELYLPCFDTLKEDTGWQDFVAAVRSNFKAFVADLCGTRLSRGALAGTVRAWNTLNSKQLVGEWCYQTLCLSCLGSRPHSMMTCGHCICDSCLHINGTDLCPVCGLRNDAELRAKPPTAGIRVLSLSGTTTDAPAIAQLLKRLRSQLRSPIHENFDLVTGSGVGLFFILMIFCKNAPIEECIHHLPNIECAKETRSAFKFGRRLKFRREEYYSSLARVTTLTPGDSPQDQAQRLWPGCKVDMLLQYSGNQFKQAEVITTADKLIASLFYLEPAQVPILWHRLPVSIVVTMKCRLPPGPFLADLIMRLRMFNAKVEFGRYEQIRKLELCPSFVWDRIRAGYSFERALHLRVASDSTNIICNLIFTRKYASVQQTLSNCPVKLCDLVASHPTCRVISQENHTVIEKIDKMEDRLRELFI